MQIDLSEKVALVTGSAHRVGKAIALELARAGVNIMVHYHSSEPEQVRDTLHDIKSLGVDAFEVQADISQPDGVHSVIGAIDDEFGRLDILVNSASVFPRADFLDISLDSWERAMSVNVRAPFILTQAAARMMLDNDDPGGAIVNICDQGVDAAWPKRPHHGISKAALWSLTQNAAVSLAPDIRVNAIVPGPVMKTAESMTDEQWEKMGDTLPLKRTGDGADVGRAVVFLCSQSFITGTLLHVNGGEHLLTLSNSRG
jgi:pteridine reductase